MPPFALLSCKDLKTNALPVDATGPLVEFPPSIGCDAVQISEKDAGDQLGVPKRIFGGEANSRGERRPSTWPSWRGGRGYPVVGQAEKAGRRPKVLQAAVSDAVRLPCISLIDVQWRNRRSNGPIKGPDILPQFHL